MLGQEMLELLLDLLMQLGLEQPRYQLEIMQELMVRFRLQIIQMHRNQQEIQELHHSFMKYMM